MHAYVINLLILLSTNTMRSIFADAYICETKKTRTIYITREDRFFKASSRPFFIMNGSDLHFA